MDNPPHDNEQELPLSRHTFDLHWLRERPHEANHDDITHSLLDDSPECRELVRPHLAQAILDHHIHDRRIAALVRRLGYDQAAAFFAAHLPKENNTRKGNFGEVVASEHLIQRYGYDMPVFKLRFRDSHELAMRGEDIIAFEMDNGSVARVIIGEAKCIVRYQKSTVRSAHKRLADAVRPRPMSLSMLSEILYNEGRDELAAEIDRVSLEFAQRDFPRQNWIILINQDQPDDPFAFLEEEDVDLVAELHCIGVSLGDLTGLVNHVFDNPVPDQGDDDAA